jgi:hypothetical protein
MLYLLFEHRFCRKPVPTFPRDALGKEKAPAEASALSGAYLSLLTAGLQFLNGKKIAYPWCDCK